MLLPTRLRPLVPSASSAAGPRPRTRASRRRAERLVRSPKPGRSIVCLHGLGGTQGSAHPRRPALGRHLSRRRDRPARFGESDKPTASPYDSPWFARSVYLAAMDALGHRAGAHRRATAWADGWRSRLGLVDPDRTGALASCSARRSPSLRFAPVGPAAARPAARARTDPARLHVQWSRLMVRRAGTRVRTEGWTAAGVDEFLRAYLRP